MSDMSDSAKAYLDGLDGGDPRARRNARMIAGEIICKRNVEALEAVLLEFRNLDMRLRILEKRLADYEFLVGRVSVLWNAQTKSWSVMCVRSRRQKQKLSQTAPIEDAAESVQGNGDAD